MLRILLVGFPKIVVSLLAEVLEYINSTITIVSVIILFL